MQKQFLKRGTLFFIGYLLSPLSLWDDVFVNIPISYVLALIVKHFSPSAFFPSMILIYWLTNLIGFLCMRKSICKTSPNGNAIKTSNAFRNDIIASVVYTFGLVILIKLKVLEMSF